MMRRVVTLGVVALVMLAMMLSVIAPAMAESQGVCSGSSGTHAAPNVVVPGSKPTVFFDCAERGEPGQPPTVVK
jgi:hypothetical protein